MVGNWEGNFQLQHPFHAQLNRAYDLLMKTRYFESHFIFLDVDDHINVIFNKKEPGHLFGTKAVLYSVSISQRFQTVQWLFWTKTSQTVIRFEFKTKL